MEDEEDCVRSEPSPSGPVENHLKGKYGASQSFHYEDTARSYASSSSHRTGHQKLMQEFPRDQTVAHYQYHDSRIDERRNEIRLVQVAAGGESYELLVVSLDQAPEYAALSYAWGDSSLSSTVTLNGADVQVGSNLGAALRQLSPTERFLWVDAICINQADSEERSAQVSKMREIYTRAKRVLVWLGKGDEGSDQAFSLLHSIHGTGRDGEHLYRLFKVEESFGVLKGLMSLFNQEYWWRVWVIQEVNVARDVVVHCGSYKLPWKDMIAAQVVLRDRCGSLFYQVSQDYRPLVDLFQSVHFRGPRSLQLNQHDWNRSGGRDLGLFDVLMGHRLKHSTDPRDKIFALVGLTSARNDPEFVIDYSLSDSQVFINATKYVIEKSGKLDIILIKPEKLGDGTSLPSWVPDWSVNHFHTYKVYRHASSRSAYDASATRDLEVVIPVQSNILQAKGLTISSLKALHSASSMIELHDCPGAVRDIYAWYSWVWDKCRDKSQVPQHFARLLLCERTESENNGEQSQTEFLASVLGSVARHGQETYPDMTAHPTFAAFANLVEPGDPGVYAWIRSIAPSLYKRRPFVTSQGDMGLAAGAIQEGDLVCVLFGCSIPVILRKVGEHYVFVSDACVADYMFGRAIDELDEGKHQEQLFEIY